jgi:F0F1-type ATP synthase delta subunit
LRMMKAVSAIFQQEPEFCEFFNTPVLSGPEKKKVIEKVFEGRISDELYHFLLI